MSKTSKRPQPVSGQLSRPTERVSGVYGAVLALVLFSGFAALVYEILWFRQLGLVFGNTVQAAATVLAAFMLGLAWGAHRARRWAARTSNPLRLFGLLEAGIGLYALVVPAALALIQLAYRGAAQVAPQSGPALTGIRFVLALIVLLVPTMLMGASLPVLAEAVLRTRDRFGSRLGWLYGSNTAGATLGVLACGFFLVPNWGIQASNWLAAAVNFSVGAGAWLLGRRPAAKAVPAAAAPPADGRRPMELLAVAGLCGFLALAFETVWFRALVLIFGATTYSFSIMVASFLIGLALGAGALGRLTDEPRRAAWSLAGALVGMGIWTLLSVRVYDAAPEMLLRALVRLGFTWKAMLLIKALLAGVFLMPLAMLSGLAFTAIVRLVRDRSGSSGDAVSAVFSVNSLGSALGAVIAGFALLPTLGLERSLLALGAGSITLGLIMAWRDAALAGRLTALTDMPSAERRFAYARRLGFTTAVLAAAACLRLGAAHWDPLILSSGAYFSPFAHVKGGRVILRDKLRSQELLCYREGKTATVAVTRAPDGRLFFSSQGKVEADTSEYGMTLQRLQGHIPMLFHPNPRRVLNIGLGAGVTAGAVTCYPHVQLEVVDIEPAATNVAAVWAAYNHDLIRRGQFSLRVNDGRNHLLVTTSRYDVITSDPFEPVMAGAGSLYTVNHFELARSRLAPGGLMAQFLPLYELSRADVYVIMRTFLRVFPRSALFFTGSDTILLGLADDARLDFETVVEKFALPEVRASLAEIGLDCPERLLELMVMDITSGDAPILDGAVNTDDLPIVEYSAPRSTLEYMADWNQKVLLVHFLNIPAAYLAGMQPEAAKATAQAQAGLQTLLQASIRRSSGDLLGCLGLLAKAVQQAPSSALVRHERIQTLSMLAEDARSAGRSADAVARYQEILQLDPRDYWALHNLVPLARNTQPDLAEECLRRGLEAYPGNAFFLALRGRSRGEDGDAAAACRDLQAALKILPLRWDFWEDYARYLARDGRPADAEAAAAHARSAKRW